MTLDVTVSGDVRGSRTVRYSGLAAWAKREELSNVPLSDRRRVAASDLQDAIPRAKLGALTIENLDDPDAALVVKAEFTASDVFSGDGNLVSVLLQPRHLRIGADADAFSFKDRPNRV